MYFIRPKTSLLLFAIMLLCLAGCTRCNQQGTYNTGSILVEDFENGSKSTYIAKTVQLRTGIWQLNDALLTTSRKDRKYGTQSIRMRGRGSLEMGFDTDGAAGVMFRYAAYGNDGASNLQLLISTDGGRSYRQLGSNVICHTGSLQQAVFKVNLRGAMRFKVQKTTGARNRVNIDDFTIYPYGSTMPAVTLPAGADTTAATDTIVAGDNGNMLLGNPSNATANISNYNNYLMVLPYYTESYNRTKGGPNWVSWYVGSTTLGRTRRMNDFRPNEALPKGWYRVQSNSYYGSGFERGHNCPSADRTASVRANSATFLMTNMIPQAPANNEHTWGNLEEYERLLVRKGYELYVVMGNYGSGGYGTSGYHTTIDKGRVNVPARIWKVIVAIPDGNNDLQRINATTRVIAVDTPNNNGIGPDWSEYICTVRDIEKATGYNLLSALPQPVQDVVEVIKDKGYDPADADSMRL